MYQTENSYRDFTEVFFTNKTNVIMDGRHITCQFAAIDGKEDSDCEHGIFLTRGVKSCHGNRDVEVRCV